MKAITITQQGPEVSKNISFVSDWPENMSPLSPGDVQVKTEASALNHMDIWVGMGIPGVDLTYPRVSGCDGAGTVTAVGAGVDESWIGQRVIFNAAVRQTDRVLPGDPPGSTLAPEYELIGEHHHGAHRESFMVPARVCSKRARRSGSSTNCSRIASCERSSTSRSSMACASDVKLMSPKTLGSSTRWRRRDSSAPRTALARAKSWSGVRDEARSRASGPRPSRCQDGSKTRVL